jgi:arsenite methyltransferase
MSTHNAEKLVDQVKERYGAIARSGATGCCGESKPVSIGLGYDENALRTVPEEADLALGCGAPVEKLELQLGETVLDLGSGAGIDVFLAARLVGPEGRVIGVDMTPEMIERARANATKAGATNVEFREGRLESLPIDDRSVDAVTSNCVINLVPDKKVVFDEIFRVLKPGGRLVISDIVLDGELPEAIERSLLAYVGCVAGALERGRYFGLLADAGLTDVTILKDIDFLALAAEEIPDDAAAILGEAGVTLEEIQGKVRSVTFRATKAG